MDNVLANWQATYYLLPFLHFCAIYSLIKLLSNKKLRFRNHFIIYLGSILLLFVSDDVITYLYIDPPIGLLLYTESLNLLLATIESYTFYSFFTSIINTIIIKKIFKLLKAGTIILLVGAFYLLFSMNSLREFQILADLLYTVQLLVLIFPGIWHIYEVHAEKAPYNHKDLILSLGFVAYCLLSVPFFSIATWLRNIYAEGYYMLFSLHFFCLGCLCISIAYYAQLENIGLSPGFLRKLKRELFVGKLTDNVRDVLAQPLKSE
ncbi:MAG TPA: hypothetical protein VM843_00405 [Flavisolibacter sp.]|jgi:hypothetical protein|nr:hypothetical protein [Flavisolibacter sp.]